MATPVQLPQDWQPGNGWGLPTEPDPPAPFEVQYSPEGYHLYGSGVRPGGLTPGDLAGGTYYRDANEQAGQFEHFTAPDGRFFMRHMDGRYGGGQWTLRNPDGSFVINQPAVAPPPEAAPVTEPPPTEATPPAAVVPPEPRGVPAPSETVRPPPTGFSYEDMVGDPGYQHRLAEGEKAIRRQANASSGVHSGATLKAIQAYGQNLASEEFAAARNRMIQDYELQLQEQLMNREIRMEDYDLARQAFFDELGLEDRARGQYYQDRMYADRQLLQEQQLLLALMGVGSTATQQSIMNASQFGGDWARAMVYGLQGWGASRFAAYGEGIADADDASAWLNNLFGSVAGMWGDSEE